MAGGAPFGVIESQMGYTFTDPAHLEIALTHSSYAGENPRSESYERYEFLGDAVLGLATTLLIFDAMPDEPEGNMTKVRALLVDEVTLADVAQQWQVGHALLLGVGEDRAGGRERSSILSDVAEAIIAAVALDGGVQAALDVVRATWSPILKARLASDDHRDPRSRLQETLARHGAVVDYVYERSGPDHDASFAATAMVSDRSIGSGVGHSKKAAAVAAARDALHRGLPGEITSL